MDDWLKNWVGLLLFNTGNNEKEREKKGNGQIIEENDKYYKRTKSNVEDVKLVYGVCYNC
jgi:hypothetical protein